MIERLKIEQDVAITQVIQGMRNCREQIIPSVVITLSGCIGIRYSNDIIFELLF